MHFAPLIPLIKPALDALKASLGATRRRLGKRKYEQALSATIKELLQQHPDITSAEAQLAALRATGVQPDASLLRAEEMLKSARGYRRRDMSAAPRARWARRRAGAKRAKKKSAKSAGRKRPARAKRKA